MRFLAYLHSMGFTQANLSRIFSENQEYEKFFRSFTLDFLLELGIKPEKARGLLSARDTMRFSMIDATLQKHSISLITLHDDAYPPLVKSIPRPPFVLYVRGHLRDSENYISVVGSRRHTKYAELALEKILPDLIASGFGIVSGGAFGVDALAHSVALAHNGYTVAVLGTGVDLVYPAQNRSLFEGILQSGGALISTFPLSARAELYNFPIRNEIVAAMSRGVLIGEAVEKSGTLITARLALDFNRDVFVIPGDINRPNSLGANGLIRDGLGKLILSSQDILSEYHFTQSEGLAKTPALDFQDELEAMIYGLISDGAQDASAIACTLDLDAALVLYKCSMLEVKGYISYFGGKYESIL